MSKRNVFLFGAGATYAWGSPSTSELTTLIRTSGFKTSDNKTTVTEFIFQQLVISDLQARGFCLDFSLIGNKLLCAQEKCYLGAEEFEVLEIYTFHTDDPTRHETVIYAIESLSRLLKGVLLNSGCHGNAEVPPILSRKIRKFWN